MLIAHSYYHKLNTRNQFFDSKEQLLISGAFIYSLWVFYFPDWLFHVMYWNNHDFVSILILYTPNEWKWKFRSLCTDYLVIYSVKKKQSSAFCSFGVRDFFIQTTLLYVRHYALIQKLIPGHKMKTVLMPNSLNSEIINTPIMLQVLQVHQYYQFVYEQVWKLMIASQ